MSQAIKQVTLGEREFILVGTAHISRESIMDVRSAIETERPDCVAIELDDQRLEGMKNPDSWKNLDIIKVLKKNQGLVLMANLVLASFQRRLGSDVGIKPGEEMKAAINIAGELGIPAVMVDRPIQVTLRRAWGKNSLWGKCKLLAVLLSSAFSREKISTEDVENLKNSNEMDSMMNEMADYLPVVKSVLIDERDMYLASHIWQCTGSKVLAVLGAGHLPGVAARLEQLSSGAISADTSAIEAVPPPSFAARSAGWLFPLVIVALVVAGFWAGGANLSGHMLFRWLLWNGSLAALGTLLAGGHILSVMTAFVCAPIGTLSPVLGVGFFAGLMQAWIKKPKVEDMERLNDDIMSFWGIYRNRILRVLLIFFLATLGGAIGNFIAVPSLAASLFR
ncbi:MAG: TraB/GumN family protein [Treponema sp.]|jgi:pheromone shutdown-related protein TraB|nr:TraB/GumN family protein [Treponema sp.]